MSLSDELTALLQQDPRLAADGQLLKNQITELALKLDKDLLRLLLSHDRLKAHFFVDVDGVLVFDRDKFVRFVNNKAFLPDSYTSFKNKIGLTTPDGRYLSESHDVVLAWPYKDCVLEGGQTQEDQRRDEIFWNELLAPDEIDRLLAPKVLTNWKRYDADGEHPVTNFAETDNLIIKGNNLLALHSLEKRFAGKVKTIYIDPPYNTGNDSFGYNDRFNHSTWLTFMRNRLEIARQLILYTGCIAIQIDDSELAYVAALADEIFGRENRVTIISLARSAATGHKAINPAPVNVADYILIYAKDRSQWQYIPQYIPRDYDSAYNLFIENYEEGYQMWRFRPLQQVLDERNISIEEAIQLFPERIARFAEPSYKGVGKETRNLIDKSKGSPSKVFRQERDGYSDIYLMNGQRILFYESKLREIDGEKVTAEAITNIWTDIAFQGIAREGNVILLKGKKPEKLLQRIINMTSENGDIVLDFFIGTGTTAAVAHKMGRRYIGIEQLDYGKNDSVQRLKNVIAGDSTGISKSVGWQGGGSFVYCELMQWNERFVRRILAAPDQATLQAIWDEMRQKAHLSYRLDVTQFNAHAAEFADLSMEDQRRFLMEVLDKNQLYVNYSEMEDQTYGVNEEDKRLNRLFYED